MTKTETDQMFASIAQGVINIAEGYTTIEKDSRVYLALALLLSEKCDFDEGKATCPCCGRRKWPRKG